MPATLRRKTDGPSAAISDRALHQLTQVLKLLADDSRLRILLLLAREGEMHVTALCDELRQSQPAVSHHLTLLRMANLVGYRRDGKFNYYYLDGARLGGSIEQLIEEIVRARGSSADDRDASYRTLYTTLSGAARPAARRR
jgi:ArsR family transcriptional regulator